MSEGRLLAVFEADGASRSDSLYTLAVMRRIENARWRRKIRIDAARGASLGMIAAGSTMALAAWTPRLELFEIVLSIAMAVFAIFAGSFVLGKRLD